MKRGAPLFLRGLPPTAGRSCRVVPTIARACLSSTVCCPAQSPAGLSRFLPREVSHYNSAAAQNNPDALVFSSLRVVALRCRSLDVDQMNIEAVYHQLAMLRSKLAATAAANTGVPASEAAEGTQTENALLTLVEANVRVVEGQR